MSIICSPASPFLGPADVSKPEPPPELVHPPAVRFRHASQPVVEISQGGRLVLAGP